ncbi:hypothetical protein TanjilG_12664 [Lupinus angustifolius]|uniref:FAF domain-containing protein n=1 Tax=Lupinus angustifolius TaxID=3871 RepID=A0A4P1QYW3_LUPAN|nr:hypothetical protein TanjilG_12664 [Lupinus angustifolius]
MDILNKCLPCKMVYIATSMYIIGTIILWCLWTHKVKNNNTKPNPSQTKKKDFLGLKTLIIELKSKFPYPVPKTLKPSLPLPLPLPQPPRRLSSLWETYPPPLLPTVRDELIGTESSDCMMSETEDFTEFPNLEAMVESCRRNREKNGVRRKFPPPISLLREALVLKRECREDGRVVMNLIPKDDGDDVELEFNGEPQEWKYDNDGEREEEEEKGVGSNGVFFFWERIRRRERGVI